MSSVGVDVLQALACPKCKAGALATEQNGSIACSRCGALYSVLRSIACLVPDVSLWRGLYLRRLSEYMWMTDARVRQFTAEAEFPDLLLRTRDRLRKMVEAKENERRVVSRLFEDLKQSAPAELSQDVPVREETRDTRLPLLECYENVFRDWVWGGPEIEICRGLIERLVPKLSGTLAVYGAGAARLALEVHNALQPQRTFALDINPLPLLITERLLAGETVGLYEFPVCPKSDAHVAVHHRIEYGSGAPPNFHLVIADASNPPFADGSLDAVLTAWFIDAVDSDLRATASAINRVLKPGGMWLNLGPLQFNTALSRCYQIEEVHELTELAGFKLGKTLQEDIPYFASPYGGSLRTDVVFGFAAAKIAEGARFEEPDPRAPWISDPSLPIPLTPEVGNLGRRSAFTAAALSLIDGRRSLVDLAQALSRSAGTTQAAMVEQLRTFLSKLPLG